MNWISTPPGQSCTAVMCDRAIALILAVCIYTSIAAGAALADSGNPTSQAQSDLVNQANAPISSVFQVRLQDAYAPAFQGRLHGQGNFFSIAITMPLPEYRLLPLPQFSLLTIPVSATLPLSQGELTAFGDVRFVDLAVIDAGHRMLFGVGPTFVFPTATTKKTGQGKWQAGPAAVELERVAAVAAAVIALVVGSHKAGGPGNGADWTGAFSRCSGTAFPERRPAGG